MSVFADVREFWRIGHPDKIDNPSDENDMLSWKLVKEEYQELARAWKREDKVEMADAMADLIYVVIGLAIVHGIPLEKVWDEVQRTNMAKFPGGVVTRREDGKIMKPKGWQPPNIKKILEEHST